MNQVLTEELGKNVQCHHLSLMGAFIDWKGFLQELASKLGLHSVGPPVEWVYPVDGKGGMGRTIIQPITTSYLVADTWEDHNGAYLMICSCKAFDPVLVHNHCEDWSLAVCNEVHYELALANKLQQIFG
jgi:hypothetical protein